MNYVINFKSAETRLSKFVYASVSNWVSFGIVESRSRYIAYITKGNDTHRAEGSTPMKAVNQLIKRISL